MLADHSHHRTGVGLDAINQDLPTLTQAVIQRCHRRSCCHPRSWDAQDPADIGLFRTPSLRGVASTAPYMHDGSVPTLDEAIDREVYYRSLQAGRPLNLTIEERLDLKAFLQAL